MAVKKSGKSSKTAHILNVLSSDVSDTSGEAGAEDSVGSSVTDFSPLPDEVLATAIRESLAQDMQQEDGEMDPEETPDAKGASLETEEGLMGQESSSEWDEVLDVGIEAPVDPTPEPAANESEEEAPAHTRDSAEAVTAKSPVKADTSLAAQTAVSEPEQPEQELLDEDPCPGKNSCYVNVMEALVEEKASKYINMFGVCACDRCVSDVKALALSNLPPKYAVMQKGHVVPMLTVYEGRFSTALTSQIIGACKKVMQEPRH